MGTYLSPYSREIWQTVPRKMGQLIEPAAQEYTLEYRRELGLIHNVDERVEFLVRNFYDTSGPHGQYNQKLL